MDRLEKILSRPTAKPYRSGKLDPDHKPYLNDDGHVDFEPGDIENPKCWSRGRRWYITVVSVLMVVNATFASSIPSGCLPVSIQLIPDPHCLKSQAYVVLEHIRNFPRLD